jgi:hypothetical protein
MDDQIIILVCKREEIRNPKNPSLNIINILHNLWLEIAEDVGKDGKQTI